MLKITTGNIIHLAIWDAAGLTVAVEKQNCSPRCVGSTDDVLRARKLIEDYEKGKQLEIPQKIIMDSYRKMLSIAKSLQAGRLAGGRTC
ncbi:MAG: hypothetical protein P4L44_16605 [Oryzomonas sp.]|uniref:hypothetical protein n=1 Tax=Oryzomonas sp. TaxID=2855186 RepID=UPI00284476EE|nr:hypothetical protein [Oryzomonas sp.]MDR3581584.1 hypothetical protein [Oryzomonas sp.]